MKTPLAAALLALTGALALSCGSAQSASPGNSTASTPTASATATAAPTSASTASPASAAAVMTVTEINASGMGGAFSPASITIKAGETVEFVNKSGNIHNVTFPDMHSPVMYAGDKWSATFSKPGTFKYVCTYHPGMEGVVIVS